MKDEQERVGWHNDASKGQQVAIRAYCFELLIANSCARPVEHRRAQSASFPCSYRDQDCRPA